MAGRWRVPGDDDAGVRGLPLFTPRTPTVGDDLKAEGMERIMARADYEAFRDDVLAVISDLARRVGEFSASRIRWECARAGVKAPHPNAWGPAMRHAVQTGTILRTGRMVASTYPPESHSRMVPVYVAGPQTS